jgi:hypothetical protein
MLSYEEFELELKKALENKYPGARITRKTQYKFNKLKKGLLIEGIGNGNVNPIVYPENLYEAYQHHEDLEFILENLDFATDEGMINQVKGILRDYERVKQYLYPYVINADKNRQCLECNDYIYEERLDLLHGVYMEVPDEHGDACINITQQLLKSWNVSQEELFSVAKRNAQYNAKPMREVIAEIMGMDISELELPENNYMYVVRAENYKRGAAAIFDTDLLKRTAEKFGMNGFYILPSSIYEIILVPDEDAPQKEMLRDMVAEVNNTQVRDEEFLSGNVYYYTIETNRVEIVEMD